MTEDHRDTSERLLAAAADLFARHGYDGTSIRDIATAADVNVAAINYHFQGKENLYHEVLRRVVEGKRDRYMEGMRAVREEQPGDARAIIRSFFKMHFEDTLKTPEGGQFLALFVRELHHGQPHTAQIISDSLIPLWEDLGESLLATMPEITPEIAPWIAGSLHGQMVHFTMRWHKAHCCTTGCRESANPVARIFPLPIEDVDEYIDTAVEHITHFSVAGIRGCIEANRALQTEGDHS